MDRSDLVKFINIAREIERTIVTGQTLVMGDMPQMADRQQWDWPKFQEWSERLLTYWDRELRQALANPVSKGDNERWCVQQILLACYHLQCKVFDAAGLVRLGTTIESRLLDLARLTGETGDGPDADGNIRLEGRVVLLTGKTLKVAQVLFREREVTEKRLMAVGGAKAMGMMISRLRKIVRSSWKIDRNDGTVTLRRVVEEDEPDT